MPRFTKETPTSFSNMTQERQREISQMGVEANKQKAEDRRSMKEIMVWLLSQKPNEEEIRVAQKLFPDIDVSKLNKKALVALRQIHKSIADGNTKSAEFVRDTSGEKPVDVIETTGAERIVYITPDMNKATQEHIDAMLEKKQ